MLFELDELIIMPTGNNPYGRQTYDLLGPDDSPAGRVVERSGPAWRVARRVFTTYRYRVPADFDVLDSAGTTELVVRRRRAGSLSAKVTGTAELLDGRPLVTVDLAGALLWTFLLRHPGNGEVIATSVRDGLTHRILDAHGTETATVTEVPLTSPIAPSRLRRAHDGGVECRFAPGTPVLVRIAVLAAVVVEHSRR